MDIYSARYNDAGKLSLTVKRGQPDMKKCYRRCAVIPYFLDNSGEINFIMSVDQRNIHTLGDFGGKSDSGETWIQTSIREFEEESYGLITDLSPELLKNDNSFVIFSDYCTLALIQIDTVGNSEDVSTLNDLVSMMYRTRRNGGLPSHLWETMGIESFTMDELEKLVNGVRVRGYGLKRLLRIIIHQVLEDVRSLGSHKVIHQ